MSMPQIAEELRYPLGASPEGDRRFYEALDALESRGFVEWRPREDGEGMEKAASAGVPHAERVYSLRLVRERKEVSGYRQRTGCQSRP